MFEFCNKKDLVFVDIEANDKPKRILQFGAFKLKTNGELETRNWFSNPKCPITPHIQKMVYKNLKNIEKGMSSIRIIEKIYKFLNNTTLITYGPFDYTFLNQMSQKLLKKKLNVDHVDLQNEWKKISMSKNVWALNKLAIFFSINVEEDKLHDAFYDAETLYKIFDAWNHKNNDFIVKKIYKYIATSTKKIKITQNKENKEAMTINNSISNKGCCFLKIDFTESRFIDSNKKLLSNIDVLEVSSNQIKRNWSFSYDVNSKDFDYELYLIALTSALKKVIISIRDKKIIVNESEYQRVIRLANLCAKYINVYPINNISFTTGYNHLYNKIDLSFYKFNNNQHLIKNWLVYKYLTEDIQS